MLAQTATRSARRAAAVLLVLGLGLTACGGDDDAAASGGSTSSAADTSSSAAESPSSSAPAAAAATVTVNAIDFDFELSEDSYAAGTYTFEVTNAGAMPHNFAVERDGQRVAGTDILQPGATATVEVTLEEGDYFFYCEVGQHRANGMEVPVSVTA